MLRRMSLLVLVILLWRGATLPPSFAISPALVAPTPRLTPTPPQGTDPAALYLPLVARLIGGEATPTRTPNATREPSPSHTPSSTASPSATRTLLPTATPTRTLAASATPTSSPTLTASASPTRTPPPSATATRTLTASVTASSSPTRTRTPTRTSTATRTPTASRTATRTPTRTPTCPPSVDYQAILDAEATWIGTLQFDLPGQQADGAIVNFRNPNTNSHMIPDFATTTAMGLLAEPQNAPRVRRYLDWYMRHVNWPDYNGLYGTVYDYYISPTGEETVVMEGNHPHYDSTDGYAASFIQLVRRYYEVTGDAQYLIDKRYFIELIGGVMRATQQPDGLTWARPDYQIKYLMDNAGVYVAFADLEWLAQEVYQDAPAAAYWRTYKNQVAAGIEGKLWSTQYQMYLPYIDGADHGPIPDWDIGYPDALAQMASLGAVVTPASPRAQHLYDTFNLHHPDWPMPNGASFPGAMLAQRAALMDDRTRADTFLCMVQRHFISRGHPWPWYSAEGGYTMLAAERLLATLP